jgi:hypothetical protein
MSTNKPHNSLRIRIGDILKGSVLGTESVLRHLPFLGFLAFLGFIAIRAAHRADYKVHQIAKLRTEVKDLESEYIETKSKLMQLSLKSQVVSRAADLGLQKQQSPPKRIVSSDE